ncbi:MAG: hypothetical protein L3J95_04390 [Thermoplasmata archaeon]|nr:hypothetical protein [Thermoplasmata archaeon]MCI4359644.1 hypothetical protein [Thermoplasmata archaeon]
MSGPLDPVIQSILFALFSGLTAILQAITGPTYEGLLVPELSPGALFPPFPGVGASFFSGPVDFSNYLVVHLVDPAVVLVAIALGLLYLSRSFLGRELVRLEGVLPRLVIYVVLANLTVPVAGAILDLAGSVYPLVASFDGGAWQHWQNLTGIAGARFSWDNGALAFVVSFVLFSLVLLLTVAVALRDALLAFLIVVLPVLTLVGALPPLRSVMKRAWLWFIEAAFLPCLLVIPLELAVGSPSILLVVAFLTLALGAPSLLSIAGTQLSQLGLPSASGLLSGGMQRGLAVASLGATSYARPLGEISGSRTSGGRAVSGASSALSAGGKAPLPAALPLAFGELLGRGAGHLVRHMRPSAGGSGARARSAGSSREEPSEFDDPIYRRFPPTIRELM